jgi:hypothetical protein
VQHEQTEVIKRCRKSIPPDGFPLFNPTTGLLAGAVTGAGLGLGGYRERPEKQSYKVSMLALYPKVDVSVRELEGSNQVLPVKAPGS